MLRLLLFGAGKTIFHKDAICEVVEKHERLRRLCPLVNVDLSAAAPKPFWVPLTKLRKEHRKSRQLNQSATRVLFRPPHFVGEPHPQAHDDGTPHVPCVLQTLTPFLESSGDLSSILNRVTPPQHVMKAGFHLVGVARTNRRTFKGFFSKNSVEKALGKMRTNSVMKAALMETVYYRQPPTKTARIYCLPLGTLKVTATRLRNRIKGDVSVA